MHEDLIHPDLSDGVSVESIDIMALDPIGHSAVARQFESDVASALTQVLDQPHVSR